MFHDLKNLDYILLVSLVLLAAFVVSRLLRFILGRFLNASANQLNTDPTQFYFLKNALNFIVFLVAVMVIFVSIPELRQLGLTLFAGAGIFAAIVGFASQAALSNIVSGIFIVIFKPFRVSDIVLVSGQYFGSIEDITLRHTVIRDIENKRFIIPNSVISSEVIQNFTINDEKVSGQIFFGISYSSDIDKAISIIIDEAEAHQFCLDNRSEEEKKENKPKVQVRVMEWADSSIKLRATVWSSNPEKAFYLKTDLLKSVKERFDRESIEIPFPHLTIINKK